MPIALLVIAGSDLVLYDHVLSDHAFQQAAGLAEDALRTLKARESLRVVNSRMSAAIGASRGHPIGNAIGNAIGNSIGNSIGNTIGYTIGNTIGNI